MLANLHVTSGSTRLCATVASSLNVYRDGNRGRVDNDISHGKGSHARVSVSQVGISMYEVANDDALVLLASTLDQNETLVRIV